MAEVELLATSAMGLEAVVARELRDLGYHTDIVETGQILFRGDLAAICRANLWLRTAGRVLVRLGEFEASDFDQLFDQTYALPWEDWIPADGAFPVNGRSRKSQLSSVPACQKIVKKAVATKLLDAHKVTHLEECGAKVTIEVTLLKDRATLTLDTTGSGLHRRGYRQLASEAPLRETLAAGLVLLSEWTPERPLIDPFCGSGTIPIEAALLGRNIAPGLRREFAAEAWPIVPGKLWKEAREEAGDLIQPNLGERIIGTDCDKEALKLARYHAEQAQVTEDIHFQQQPFKELRSPRGYGCLITNPPYAQRMGQEREVRALYASMPGVFRRLASWSFYVFTAEAGFEKLLGQPADKRRKLYNGRIECHYYQFSGPGYQSEKALLKHDEQSSSSQKRTVDKPKQAFGGLTEKAYEQAASLRSRLTKRSHHFRKWPTRQGITCYRLYDRDIPEIPLVVDRYENCLNIAEYDRPHERSSAQHADWLDLMKQTAAETLDVRLTDTFLKHRRRQKGLAQYERCADEQQTCVVIEGGLRFEVNLSDYVDVGLFLDHRITRGMVREEARAKRFLNLFGYTGSFTVYAAAGGAKSTTTVDLSNTYLKWAERNMALNRLLSEKHRFIRKDVMSFLREHPVQSCYDLAVVDPPKFSNSKGTDDFFDVQRDYVELLSLLLELMAPDGCVFFSTNFRNFKLNEEQLTGMQVREISQQTIPADFRNKRIHRTWRISKAEEAIRASPENA